MLDIGDVVTLNVTDVETYGVFFSSSDGEVLVLAPEVAWSPNFVDCRDFTFVNNRHRVKILRREESGRFIGSIRQSTPETDPWKSHSIQEGEELEGIVADEIQADDASTAVPFGYVVEDYPGVKGVLRTRQTGKRLAHGEHVKVTVERIDSSNRRLDLSDSETNR